MRLGWPRTQVDHCEAVDLKSGDTLRAEARRVWNASGRPPVQRWLLQKQDEVGKERLLAAGNIVIPKQAELAIQVLAFSDKKV